LDECGASPEPLGERLKETLMTNVTVRLPDELARQAQSAGLLRDDAIAARLREVMQKRQVDQLFDTMG
jgi:hypothetical protein